MELGACFPQQKAVTPQPQGVLRTKNGSGSKAYLPPGKQMLAQRWRIKIEACAPIMASTVMLKITYRPQPPPAGRALSSPYSFHPNWGFHGVSSSEWGCLSRIQHCREL